MSWRPAEFGAGSGRVGGDVPDVAEPVTGAVLLRSHRGRSSRLRAEESGRPRHSGRLPRRPSRRVVHLSRSAPVFDAQRPRPSRQRRTAGSRTDHFASWNGTAPIDASSGDHTRHRLSRGGNRQINRAIHIMAIVQLRTPPKAAPTSTAAKRPGRPPWKPCAASNAASPTLSTAPCCTTPQPRRPVQEGNGATTLTPAQPAQHPPPALRTSHKPDPPTQAYDQPSPLPLDTEGCQIRKSLDKLKASGALDEIFARIDAGTPLTGVVVGVPGHAVVVAPAKAVRALKAVCLRLRGSLLWMEW